jgi:hypothetical protein
MLSWSITGLGLLKRVHQNDEMAKFLEHETSLSLAIT